MDRSRVVAAIVSGVAVTALVGWMVFNPDGSGDGVDASSASSSTGVVSASPSPSSSSSSSIDRVRGVLVGFEHARRDWGVDPAAAKAGVDPVSLRWDVPSADKLKSYLAVDVDSKYGPDVPGPYCATGEEQAEGVRSTAQCATWPTMGAYWHDQAWTLGARMTGEPTVEANGDGRWVVSGSSRVIAWSDATGVVSIDATDGNHYWGFTPRLGTVSWQDTLTVDDEGKITDVVSNTVTDWLADPLLANWRGVNPLKDNDRWMEREQLSIPVKGEPPVLKLNQDSTAGRIVNDPTMSGDLWKNISESLPDTSCQGCAL